MEDTLSNIMWIMLSVILTAIIVLKIQDMNDSCLSSVSNIEKILTSGQTVEYETN